jgi:hypothetical protein
MVHRIDNEYTEWNIDKDEYHQVYVLSDMQIKGIQTKLFFIITSLSNLTLDSADLVKSAIDQAFLQGQKVALEKVLQDSEEHRNTFTESIEDSIRSNRQVNDFLNRG